ncbi:tyrosine-type recombinase/integrase [Nonomuraea sp. MG754425]|uniref:tyrosine-type recombinase/integrase n=1 Tax=Nonomuraea sp. MG754425 TaxID=2570319 RepID=UPI0034D409A1
MRSGMSGGCGRCGLSARAPSRRSAACRWSPVTCSTGIWRTGRAVKVSQLAGRIFVTDTGGRFYRSSASALVTRIGRQAGILAKVTAHVLRHTWASLAAELGADPFEIKEALDHESMDTTMGYVHSGRQLERDLSQLVASALE